MSKTDYARVIQELCTFASVDDWAHVVHTQHAEVLGTVVGLIYDEERTCNTLCLYFDLRTPDDPMLHKKLLRKNICNRPGGIGYFALHPEKETVVYRVNIPLTPELTGEELYGHVISFLQEGNHSLDSVLEVQEDHSQENFQRNCADWNNFS